MQMAGKVDRGRAWLVEVEMGPLPISLAVAAPLLVLSVGNKGRHCHRHCARLMQSLGAGASRVAPLAHVGMGTQGVGMGLGVGVGVATASKAGWVVPLRGKALGRSNTLDREEGKGSCTAKGKPKDKVDCMVVQALPAHHWMVALP